MKSIVIEKPGQLSILQQDIPTPKPKEVRVKVIYAGICGSDNHIYHGSNPFVSYPRVIGHEFFGIIDAVGDNVNPQRIGERVVVDPVISCGHCYPCSIGKPNVCSHLNVLGVHRDGGFSQYCCVPTQNAYRLDEAISDREAVMVEPFSIAANVMKQVNPLPQDIALIYGAGPMGLTMVQVLKGVFKIKHIIAVDRINERLNMAIENGADTVINSQETPLVEYLTDHHISPTLIIDAACHPSILSEAISLASPAARICILGFSEQPSTIIQKAITSKQLALFSSRLNGHCFPQVIDWIINKQIQADKLITQQIHYTDIIQGLNQFATDQRHCCKIIVSLQD